MLKSKLYANEIQNLKQWQPDAYRDYLMPRRGVVGVVHSGHSYFSEILFEPAVLDLRLQG